MNRTLPAVLWLVSASAFAHVSVISGVGFANTTQEITFGVGHGCEGPDTYSVRIEIPSGVTSVRPTATSFGNLSVETNAAGLVTAVTFTKPPGAIIYEPDIAYYKLSVRMKLPNAPFTKLYFPAKQTCRTPAGVESVVDWSAVGADAGVSAEPSPEVVVVPARRPGWNSFVVPIAVTDLSTYFNDAQIVWRGAAAYSPNAAIVDIIKTTSGVTELTSLAAQDTIWVKY